VVVAVLLLLLLAAAMTWRGGWRGRQAARQHQHAQHVGHAATLGGSHGQDRRAKYPPGVANVSGGQAVGGGGGACGRVGEGGRYAGGALAGRLSTTWGSEQGYTFSNPMLQGATPFIAIWIPGRYLPMQPLVQ
jgi:hypothetical protein